MKNYKFHYFSYCTYCGLYDCALLQLVSVLFYQSTIVPTLVKYSEFLSDVQSIKLQQQLYEKHLCNQNRHYEKYKWCRGKWNIHCTWLSGLTHYIAVLVIRKHLCNQS